MNKLVFGLIVVLVISMAFAGISNSLVFAKHSENNNNNNEGSNTSDNSKSNSDTGSGDNPSGDTGSDTGVKSAIPTEPTGLTPAPEQKPGQEHEQKICMIPEGCGNDVKAGQPFPDNLTSSVCKTN